MILSSLRCLNPHRLLVLTSKYLTWNSYCTLQNQSPARMSTMAKFNPVTHVIFDMDGLLLVARYGLIHWGRIAQSNIHKVMVLQKRAVKILADTEKIYKKIISDITNSYGKEYTKEVQLKVLGTTEQQTASTIVAECGLPVTAEEFITVFRQKQTNALDKGELMAGAERLVRHLHANRVPVAVATSSGSESVKVKTANHKELFSLFHHIVMGSTDPEVLKGKPAPDIFQVCAKRFPDTPDCSKCLVFEDAPNGVKGAVDAGMQTVMVPDAELPLTRTIGATIVIESLLDFDPSQFGLPPFRN